MVTSLLLLGFFKYYDFIATSLNSIGISFIKPLGISLPIGIFFYTFQTMSYTIDVYRRDTQVQKDFIAYGTYVALFPQLIAGPIVRYQDVADQMKSRVCNSDVFASGVRRFMVGLGKKVLLANNIGQLWNVYQEMAPGSLSVTGAWLGLIAFSFQLYFDFSGYSDMAIGLGRMLGFEFLENFNYPYISKSISEFWRRWHISLGTWFREYVYIPLGGNRVGKGRLLFNLLVVWMLTGIWHGANWNFLIWGLYYAVLIILERLFLGKLLDRLPAWVGHVYALFFVVLGWALFSIEDMSAALSYISAMFGGNGVLIDDTAIYYLRNYGVSLIILALASTPLPTKLYNKLSEKQQAIAAPCIIALMLVVCTGYLVDATYNPFLYFRF